jgi:hypothetical protein
MFKRFFKRILRKDESSLLLKELKLTLDKLDNSKWYHPKITYKEFSKGCYGYGFTNKKDSDLVPIITRQKHPSTNIEWYDGPFTAYPLDIDISVLCKRDRESLTRYFREKAYND